MNIKFNDIMYDKLVLHSNNIQINKGKITVVTGESGSGKTSLFRTILDCDYNGNKVYSFASICPQVPCFIDNLTVGDHFNLIRDLTTSKDIDRYISILNIDKLMDLYPSQLSGGEQKRVGFILTVCKDNDLIILDEPTASLNSEYSNIYIDILNEVKKDKCILIFTHDTILTGVGDIRYHIIDNELKILSNEVIEDNSDIRVSKFNLDKMINYFFKIQKNYSKIIKLVNIVLLVLISVVGFEISYYKEIKEYQKNIIDGMNSSELLVYKASEHAVNGEYVMYTYGHEKPITDEDLAEINKIKYIESVEWRYDDLEPNYEFNNDITNIKFNSENSKKEYTILIKENDKQTTLDIDRDITISTYLKDRNYDNNIEKKINKTGVYISRSIANLLKEKLMIEDDNELKDKTLEFDIAVPLYNTYGRWQGITVDEEMIFIYSTTICHETVELPIAGILEWNTMGIENDFTNGLYIDRDILEKFINEHKVTKDRTLYVFGEDYNTWYENNLPSDIKEKPNRVFEDKCWKPTSLSIFVDGVENVFEVTKELEDLGYTVESEYINNKAINGGLVSMKNVYIYSAIILDIVIVIGMIAITYIRRKKEDKIDDCFKQLGLRNKEITYIRNKYYLNNTIKCSIISLIGFGCIELVRILMKKTVMVSFISVIDIIIINIVCFYLIPMLGKKYD